MGRIKTLLQSSSLRWNFVGNVTGRLWVGITTLVTVPVFVHLLGTDAFGIVSLVGTFQALLGLLDFGIAGTANREVAIARATGDRGRIADTVRTFEVIYWTVALVIGLGFAGLSGWLANSWVTKQSLSPADIRMAVILGGVALAARWPVALYTGILQGLERQVIQNGIAVFAVTARVGLTIVALIFVSRTVYCFLVTQALANVMEVLLNGYVARRLAMVGAKGRFDLAVVQRVWRFAVGYNLVVTFVMLITSAPQLLISKLLPLAELTYYSVAGTAAGILLAIYIPAHVALFPRLVAHFGQQNLAEMRRLYLLILRFTVYLCAAPTIVLCFFPSEVVALWTGSPELTQHVRPILPVLAVGNLVNCASNLLYNILLATGNTRVPLFVNAISLPLMVAGGFMAIRAFGVSGGALCWLAFNVFCFGIYGRYCFTSLFSSGPRQLLYGLPLEFLIAQGIVIGVSKLLLPVDPGTLLLALWLVSTMILSYSAGILGLRGEERRMLAATLRRYGLSFRKLFCKKMPSLSSVGL
jgi:O-antigen/teichoic acid export membrane protein